MNLTLLIAAGTALALAGCGEPQPGVPAETGASPPSQVPSGVAAAPDADPLWLVSLAYGTLTAIDRSPSATPPDGTIDADLWIISDLQGGSDTMQIALTLDCQARTYAFRQITSYAGSTLIEEAPAGDTAAHPAQPDTPYADALGYVCEANGAQPRAPDYADFTAAQAARVNGG